MERRINRRSGSSVWFSRGRQLRPNLPHTACPFCPGGLEAPDPYDVRWFPNRWPPMPDDRCEILLFCHEHGGSLAALPVAQVRKVVDLWARRTEAQGDRDDVDYVLVFENRGADAGATIAHPHGQLYAFDAVPPAAERKLHAASCVVCDELSEGHDVTRSGSVRVVVPNAATWPYELLIAPTDHVPDLSALDGARRDDLAAALVDGLGRLDRLFGEPMPYMLWLHQRPTDEGVWPRAHVHIEVAPLWRASGVQRFVAAGEWGSGVFFNPLLPEDAAAQLRSASDLKEACRRADDKP